MARFMNPRSALVALALFAGLFFAGGASAQCDANNPLMVCPLAECIALQANVVQICKNPAPVSCEGLTGCNVLRREKQHWLDCYTARTIINMRCFSGGNLGHQERAAEAIRHVGVCEAMMREPEPVGCGDPCPF
ncbi:MAG: hypothetical protein ACJ76J_00250 [Thermoanaerobaculia bacterium]